MSKNNPDIKPVLRVAFSGRSGSGKTTAVDYLSCCAITGNYDDRLKNVEYLMLAQPLKRAAATLFGMEFKVFDDVDTKDKYNEKLGCKPRDVIIALGRLVEEVVGKNNKFIESNPLLHQIAEKCADRTKSVVISDMRLPIESQVMKELDILRVRIVSNRLPPLPANADRTETGCECDVEIDNSGTIEEFYRKLDEVLNLARWKAS